MHLYICQTRHKIVIWKAEIVFDESRLKKEDIVFDTIDMKIRAVEFCINK